MADGLIDVLAGGRSDHQQSPWSLALGVIHESIEPIEVRYGNDNALANNQWQSVPAIGEIGIIVVTIPSIVRTTAEWSH